MSSYSIKDLEILSGIKAHTLRIWEQRYQIIAPSRTDTNIRQYSGEDLKMLLNISLLNDNGYKISKIANMSKEELTQEVILLSDKNNKNTDQIHALTLAMIDLDEARFDYLIGKNIQQIGIEKTMISIIYPFLGKIGLMWQTGSVSPAQEHFMTNLIRQKMIVAIDSQQLKASNNSKKFLLFLAEGELHELSLLFANYLVKSRNQHSIYLGQSLPFKDLEETYKAQKPDYLISIITSIPTHQEVQKFVYKLGETFSKSTILLSGYQVVGQDIDTPENVLILNSINDLIELLDEIR